MIPRLFESARGAFSGGLGTRRGRKLHGSGFSRRDESSGPMAPESIQAFRIPICSGDKRSPSEDSRPEIETEVGRLFASTVAVRAVLIEDWEDIG
jgi:hypothetical protein